MVMTGLEPTLVTLFGEGRMRRYSAALGRGRLGPRLRRLSPKAKWKLASALEFPTAARLQGIAEDPELMGLWPQLSRAANDGLDFYTGDYADLAQKGLGIFKRFGKGGIAVLQKMGKAIKARRARKHGRTAPAIVPMEAPPAEHGKRGGGLEIRPERHEGLDIHKLALPAAAALALYLIMKRRQG